jgi:hypothetical protein
MIQSRTTAYVGGRGWGGAGGGGGGGRQERRAAKITIIQQQGNEISSFLDIYVGLDSVLHGLLDSRVPEN